MTSREVDLNSDTLIDIDAFLKLPVWTETVVSKGDPIPEEQCLKLHTNLPLEVKKPIPEKSSFQKNLEKPNSKIAAATEKKEYKTLLSCKPNMLRRGLQKLPGRRGSNAEGTATATLVGPIGDATNVEREVVDLSDNTRVSTPPSAAIQPSPRLEHTASDAHSFHSSHHEETEDSLEDCQFVPNWGLRDNLRICTFRACKELATSAEEEFLGNLTNVEHLNHSYVDLCNRSETYLEELAHLRTSLQKEMQANVGLNKRLALLDSAHSSCSDQERELAYSLKDMEKERDDWRHTTSDQFRRSGVADSYLLSMVDLIKVSPDAPTPLHWRMRPRPPILAGLMKLLRDLCPPSKRLLLRPPLVPPLDITVLVAYYS
ncbi:hypothetical protein Tco_1073478 [Tanacetum coccineum]